MDYKEKIKKLLKLAESPNEHEAKAALCKARQIMAEHKLREEDFIELEKAKVIKRLVCVGGLLYQTKGCVDPGACVCGGFELLLRIMAAS